MRTLIALGGALIDLIIQCPYESLPEKGCIANESVLLTAQNNVQTSFRSVGGSSCNATAMFTRLGGKAVFISAIGNDKNGKFFQESLKRSVRVLRHDLIEL